MIHNSTHSFCAPSLVEDTITYFNIYVLSYVVSSQFRTTNLSSYLGIQKHTLLQDLMLQINKKEKKKKRKETMVCSRSKCYIWTIILFVSFLQRGIKYGKYRVQCQGGKDSCCINIIRIGVVHISTWTVYFNKM